VKTTAPSSLRPGAGASVCAITDVETEAQAKVFGATIGSNVYLIEFGDGSSIEVSEDWLEADNT
jgi:hypothetical protein